MENPGPTDSERRLLGFSREEWALGHADDPFGVANALAFFDAVATRDGESRGLAYISIDSWLALAGVSPAFARRVADGLSQLDPGWRARAEESARAEGGGSLWGRLLALIDEANQ